MGDYLENVLGQKNKVIKATVYSIIFLVGSLTENIIGTSIFNRFSNYNMSETSLLCIYFCVLTGMWVYKYPISSEIKAFTTKLFAFFFFGNCMMILLIN